MRPGCELSAFVAAVALGGCGGGMLGGPSPMAGGGGTGTGGSTIGPNCGSISTTAAKVQTDILVVLDRSGSMNSDLGGNDCGGDCGGSSRWAQLTSAVSNVVAANPTDVNWGLKVFADSDNKCGVGNGVQVPVGPNNSDPVAGTIAGWTSASGGLRSGSQSPASLAENAAARYLGTLAESNPKYILLATDGLANCAIGGADPATDDSAGAIGAVQAAFNTGFPTFVVGAALPGSPADATLNAMANAGGVPRSGTPAYYSGATAAELANALMPLITKVASCNFALPQAPNSMTSNDFIDVYADGVQIPRDTTDMNGWDYTDADHRSIQIYGSTCAAIVGGTVITVTVTFRCGGLA